MKRIRIVIAVVIIVITSRILFAENTTVIHGLVCSYNIKWFNYVKPTPYYFIKYPQITDLSDKNKESKINKEIKKSITLGTKDKISNYRGYFSNSKIVWRSEKLLSIITYVNCMGKSAAHPYMIINTLNIDMKTGNIIKLNDLLNCNNKFKKLFKNKAQIVYDETVLDLTGKDGRKELKRFKNDMFANDNIKYEFDNNSEYYFTSTGIVFVYEVIFAYGSYEIFSLKYSDLRKYIKKSAKWSDISSEFPNTNFQTLPSQCFKINGLTDDKKQWFISGCNLYQDGLLKNLKFYLSDTKGNITYRFPKFSLSKSGADGYRAIDAVSFIDINRDGKKDVIVLAKRKETDVAGKILNDDAVGIYLHNKNKFILADDLNKYLNHLIKPGVTISDVIKRCNTYYKILKH